jgi:hypothetical protein
MSATDDAPRTSRGRGNTLAIGGAALIAVAALAFGGAALTNAWFTSTATVDAGTATTATVKIAASASATAPAISLGSMLPGDTADTTLVVENTGTEDVYLAVGPFTATGDPALRDALVVTVTAGGASQSHTLEEWRSGRWQGLTLAAHASTDVAVHAELPTDAGNDLQDTSTTFSVSFDAIQRRNVGAPPAGWVAVP